MCTICHELYFPFILSHLWSFLAKSWKCANHIIICSYLCTVNILCSHLCTVNILCSCLISFDLIWSHLISFDLIWSHLISFDLIWSHSYIKKILVHHLFNENEQEISFIVIYYHSIPVIHDYFLWNGMGLNDKLVMRF